MNVRWNPRASYGGHITSISYKRNTVGVQYDDGDVEHAVSLTELEHPPTHVPHRPYTHNPPRKYLHTGKHKRKHTGKHKRKHTGKHTRRTRRVHYTPYVTRSRRAALDHRLDRPGDPPNKALHERSHILVIARLASIMNASKGQRDADKGQRDADKGRRDADKGRRDADKGRRDANQRDADQRDADQRDADTTTRIHEPDDAAVDAATMLVYMATLSPGDAHFATTAFATTACV